MELFLFPSLLASSTSVSTFRTEITLRELELGHGKRDYFPAMKKALLGEPEYNVRARKSNIPKCPTVRDQIECLIDQATDDNILGRCWQGLATWM